MCKVHWRSLVPGRGHTRSARLTDSYWTAKRRTACWLQRARKSIDNRDWPDAALVSRRLWWAIVLCGQRRLRFSDLELLPAAPSVLHGVVSNEKRNRGKKDSHWRIHVPRGERMAMARRHVKHAWPPDASTNSQCTSGSGAMGSMEVARCKP